MRSVYINEFGDLDNLSIRDVPAPAAPSGTQVVVQVRAAGLNRADLLQVRGSYPPPAGFSPNIPGLEFAGEVAGVGNNVTAFKTGDRVFGITAGEAQAEFLSTDQSLLTRIPAGLSFAEAAAVPEAFITAHDAISTLGGLRQGETLLIHAVGSGVGLAALQIAKAIGATVIGTSRTQDKLDKCKQFGLDAGVLPLDGKFADAVLEVTSGRGCDVILDLVGAAYFADNIDSLAVKGRLILVGLTSGSKAEFDLAAALRKRARIIGTVLRARPTGEKAEATRKFAGDVIPFFETGKIKPNLDRAFAFEDVATAYKYLASNESFGKVVLEL
jgi:putative PIG3 family NAD(P)H quinone oxidoreductase